MFLLNSFWSWVIWVPLNCKYHFNGYAGSPYIHNLSPFGRIEKFSNTSIISVMTSMLLSWRLPSTGPNRLAIIPFGVVIDWYFNPCSRLCLLKVTLWFLNWACYTSQCAINKTPDMVKRSALLIKWICKRHEILRSKPLLISAHQFESTSRVKPVDGFITYHTQLRYRSRKSMHHVRISKWKSKPF